MRKREMILFIIIYHATRGGEKKKKKMTKLLIIVLEKYRGCRARIILSLLFVKKCRLLGGLMVNYYCVIAGNLARSLFGKTKKKKNRNQIEHTYITNGLTRAS